MAKSASPVRLQAELMESARVNGSIQHRSAAEQIEYWADIGRKVSRNIDPDALLAVEAGLAHIKVEKIKSAAVDPESVFAALDANRESGELASAIAEQSPIRYQASKNNPGLLEQIDEAGRKVVGQFLEGEFVPTNAK
ncbi:MAG: hypothetical protein DRR42_27035 [Gammaproteobacteria bacterium]|nr:MAG: hypothetical protein DRR42_27035 [Gammaproteobacteria bacterium]